MNRVMVSVIKGNILRTAILPTFLELHSALLSQVGSAVLHLFALRDRMDLSELAQLKVNEQILKLWFLYVDGYG